METLKLCTPTSKLMWEDTYLGSFAKYLSTLLRCILVFYCSLYLLEVECYSKFD